MTLQQLYDQIGSQLKIMPRAGNHEVVIEAGLNHIGGTPTVQVKYATNGIDWDDGFYILTPIEPLEKQYEH